MGGVEGGGFCGWKKGGDYSFRVIGGSHADCYLRCSAQTGKEIRAIGVKGMLIIVRDFNLSYSI